MRGLQFTKEDDPELFNSLTPGTSEQASPMPTVPAPMPQLPPQAPPQEVLPPPAPIQKKLSPKLPGMPEDMTADEIEPYLNTQKQSLNKYGPEAQMDLQNRSLTQRNNIPNSLVSGAKGFADALMMGVAGAGNPGWQQSFENRQDRQAAEQQGTLERAGQANLQRTESGMKLDSMNPKSAISKSAQRAYESTLIDAGVPKSMIPAMSASLIGDVAAKRITLADAIAKVNLENTWKKAEVGQRGQQITAQIENEKSQRERDAQKMRMDAAEKRSKLGILDKVLLHRNENKALADIMNSDESSHSFASEEEAAKAGLPDGTPIKVNGVKGKWHN